LSFTTTHLALALARAPVLGSIAAASCPNLRSCLGSEGGREKGNVPDPAGGGGMEDLRLYSDRPASFYSFSAFVASDIGFVFTLPQTTFFL
jgi:hypothetical protein